MLLLCHGSLSKHSKSTIEEIKNAKNVTRKTIILSIAICCTWKWNKHWKSNNWSVSDLNTKKQWIEPIILWSKYTIIYMIKLYVS